MSPAAAVAALLRGAITPNLTCSAAAKRQRPSSGVGASIPFYVGRYEGAALDYGPHYSFYGDVDKIMKDHVDLFKAWHPGGTLLDIGGRNGELHSLAKDYGYAILERDLPTKWAQKRFKYYACDLYNCGAKLAPCLVELIYCNNVLEHLLMPHKAIISMAELLKPGGLLLLKTQWLWRYHAQKTYGDYFRFSARALEYLCIQAGLNPIFSGYQQMLKGAKKLVRGSRPGAPDTPPVELPLASQYPTFVICYKPRAGERHVKFEEVADQPVANHPRFNLALDQPHSEAHTHIRPERDQHIQPAQPAKGTRRLRRHGRHAE